MSNSEFDDIDNMDDLDGLDDFDSLEGLDDESTGLDDEPGDLDSVDAGLDGDIDAELDGEDAGEDEGYDPDAIDDDDDLGLEEEESSGAPLKLIGAAVLGLAVASASGYSILKQNGFIGGASAPVAAAPQQPYVPYNPVPAEPVAPKQVPIAPFPDPSAPADPVSGNGVDLGSNAQTTAAQPSLAAISLGAEQFREILAEELGKQSESDREWISGALAKQSTDIKAGLSIPGIAEKLESLGITVSKATDKIAKEIQGIKVASSEVSGKPPMSAADRKALLAGRERLEGFQVVNASEDHAISIVRSPSGRISAFFEGETFYSGNKTHRVSGIRDQGNLVLVGDDAFIDEIYVKPAPKKVAKAKKPAPKPDVERKPQRQEEKVVVAEAPKEKASAPVEVRSIFGGDLPSKGWSFHGIFEDGYLLNTPKGDWVILRNGQYVDGMGRVSGIDSNRQLLIGSYLIPLAV